MGTEVIEGPNGVSFSNGGKESVPIYPSVIQSRNAVALAVALRSLTEEKVGAPSTITNMVKRQQGVYRIEGVQESGTSFQTYLHEKDITQKLIQQGDIEVTFTPSIDTHTPSYNDGFSLAATHYFQSNPISEVELFSMTHTESRVVLRDGKIQVLKGISRSQGMFRFIFEHMKMLRRYSENQETIKTYVDFLTREMGPEKLKEIQETYGFDFSQIRYLEPKHIYLCNIGMNNIEYRDMVRFQEDLAKGKPDGRVIDLKGILTNRAYRGMIRMFGPQARLSELPDLTVGQMMQILETPKEEWEKIYTGRKFKSPIKGSYNRDISDKSKFRPWVDQQELLQIFNDIKNPFPGHQFASREKLDRFFYEMLTKVVVKKHLMRSSTPDGSRNGEWRVGAMIPSPYKDKNGDTVYYHVSKGVDSGHGKLWIVLKPASKEYDSSLPVIRIPRDTSRDRYAQRGGHTLTRDLSANPGYRNTTSTLQEDKEFFREFTLPLWMAQLGRALVVFHQVNGSSDLSPLQTAVEETYKELLGDLIGRVQANRLDPEIKEKVKEKLTPIYREFKAADGDEKIRKFQEFVAVLEKVAPYSEGDFNRFHDLLMGEKPRPLASIGNSLGGFDAQHDFFAHTFRNRRIPITDVSVYTHSSLKVSKEDDNVFSNYVVNNADLLKTIGVHIHLDHITELNDPVSLATTGTFLGQGAQMAALDKKDFPVSVSFRVVEPLDHPRFKEAKIHRRRFEDLVEGVDYRIVEEFREIHAYDAHAQKYKLKGRTVEDWRRTGLSLGLGQMASDGITTWRRLKGAHRHIPKALSNHKLVVSSNALGESTHDLIPVKYRRDLEYYIYPPNDFEEFIEL